MFESGWEDPKRHPARCFGEKLYDDVLPAVLGELDPERPYIPTSPWGGARSNDGGMGDQHYWDVWHGRGDWKHYRDSTGRFASEFGFAAAPGHAVWKSIFGGDESGLRRDVRDPLARWHDKTGKGYDTFVSYVELHYPPARDIEEHAYTSQLNQRDALRFGIEHFRRTAGCRGSLIWQLNDCWPVQSWAVLDFAGEYKAAAFELRRLYASAHASLEHQVGDPVARLWTMLDNVEQGVSGEASLEARRLSDGELLERWSEPVSLQPGQRGVSLQARVSSFEALDTLLVASFLGVQTFRLLAEPKHARVTAPRLAAYRHPLGVVIETDRPVVDLFLWDPTGELKLLDNFVTLAESGRQLLRAEGPFRPLQARSLAGRHPVLC
jgi:beta-mannosidase